MKWRLTQATQAVITSQKQTVQKYGFISVHKLSRNHNLALAFFSLPAIPTLTQPRHAMCHNLCTTTAPPPQFSSLPKLGLNYCLCPSKTMSLGQFSTMEAHFCENLCTKCAFAGQESDWQPGNLYLPSPDWNPEEHSSIPDELKIITNQFFHQSNKRFCPEKPL